ncbi:MAG TPA: ATP synthase F1 subunit gamma [Candidatus Saccharimonadales bacterium]|nr:ATP synthase F1 subunit gamma [Candidatus Saccharimonadales bacterium]
MASLITLKRRIGSIRSTRQITKAMELVSASKLRRAQEQARLSRAYREAAYRLLARLNAMSEITDTAVTAEDVTEQPLFQKRPVDSRLYIVITSNSGLAGAYNVNVLKLLAKAIGENQKAGIRSSVITIGNRGVQFVRTLAGVDLLAHYPAFGDKPTQADIQPILTTILAQYSSAAVDEVLVLYTLPRSGILQEAVSVPLLPAQLDQTDGTDNIPLDLAMNFEPDIPTVIHHITARLIEVQLWQFVLESLASEHSMRMLAMKNATDNANELIGDYTLEYNTARQAAITQELAEITGGAEAMKG